ncbi:hypothetical protein BHD05_11185 [Marisediminicola antarctica]|uniref:Uncharacterized protein n=1 Tax=Marisediminicola antarctica TaxID=674079 RepID=A0A7L5AHR2_9MICO|nr:hypothetical protein BHD05_11185 [Marisediminicola antarctica]
MKDAFANAYIETERILVGDPSAILVRDDGILPPLVTRILTEVARPGYRQRDAAAGVPDGWILFSEVQILKAPSPNLVSNQQLDVLVPRLSTQMALTGGLRLPGRIARWSAVDQPQLAVASDEARQLRVTCTPRDIEGDEAIEIELATPQHAPFLVDIAPFKLPTGDYVVTLYMGDKRLQTQTLRLRSSDSLDQYSWNKIEHLAHRDSDPLWPVRAVSGEGSIVVDGAFSVGSVLNLSGLAPAPSTSWRRQVTPRPSQSTVRIDSPPSDSCIVTGAHKIRLPTFSGKPEGRWLFGSCSQCGVTKRSPAQSWDKELQKRKAEDGAVERISVANLTPAQPQTQAWAAVVDALIYLGTGSAADLRALARQIEDTAAFEHHLVRSLESLGVIETYRDDEFRVQRFEIASTCLAELEDTSLLVTGAWPRETVQNLYRAARELGGEALVVEPDSAHLPLVAGVDPLALLAESADVDVEIARAAGRSMLLILPTLSEVAAALPRVDAEFTSHAEYFSTGSASWLPVRNIARPGAYRTKSAYNSTYLYRTADDVENGTVARVPFDLAKHLAAQISGAPLVAYNAASQQLRVPSGANLPGLYERAAVLCSGELPLRDASTFSLVYTEIDEIFAHALMARLV